MAAIAAFVLASAATGQSNVPPFGEGTQAFRTVLKSQGLTPLQSPNDLRENAGQKILIVFGKPDILDDLCGDRTLPQFLDGGGAFLLATDRPTPDSIFDLYRIRVNGAIVQRAAAIRLAAECPSSRWSKRAGGPSDRETPCSET